MCALTALAEGLSVLRVLTFLLLVLTATAGRLSGEAVGNSAEPALRPRCLSREELVSLPLVRRDIATGNATSTGGTAELRTDASWSLVSQAKDRQSYYTVIKVGDINFRVALDTGSSDLWLVSSECKTAQCNGLPKYPLNYQSPSFQSVNGNATVFNASYADGTLVSGFVAREKVELGQLLAANLSFGLISNSNVTLNDQESGILGLGFARLSVISNAAAGSVPFFTSLAQHGLVNYPLFGFNIAPNSTGSLSLGAIDASIVADPRNISWNDVAQFAPFGHERNTSSYLHWAISLSSFGINGTQLTPLPTQVNATGNVSLALFDIGTIGIYGPYQDVSRLYGLIDGARLVDSDRGQWAIPCDTNISMSLTFGREYILHPSDYIIGSTASGNLGLCLSWPRALPPSADGIDWQIGSTFLQTVYTIFSYGINTKEPPKIGLYPLSTPNNATASSMALQSSLRIPPAAQPTTISTTLPNFLVPTPTFSTPAYIFNTSIPASVGGIVKSELATSTYHAILAQAEATDGFNASAIPTISPPPPFVTLTLTDGNGSVRTTVSTYSLTAEPLGVPPGWSAGARMFNAGSALGLLFTFHALLITIWLLDA